MLTTFSWCHMSTVLWHWWWILWLVLKPIICNDIFQQKNNIFKIPNFVFEKHRTELFVCRSLNKTDPKPQNHGTLIIFYQHFLSTIICFRYYWKEQYENSGFLPASITQKEIMWKMWANSTNSIKICTPIRIWQIFSSL